jgi:hypothetical protein
MSGDDVADMLTHFAARFRRPARGRYVLSPALADENGVYFVPPAPRDATLMYAAGAAIAATGLIFLAARSKGTGSGSTAGQYDLMGRKS